MPSQKKLASHQAKLILPPEDDPLKITYLPGRISPYAMNEADKGIDQRVQVIFDALVEWNITEDDEPDSPILPLTLENVARQGIPVLESIMSAMIMGAAKGEVTGMPSSTPTPPASTPEGK